MRFVVGSVGGAREDSPGDFDLAYTLNLVKASLLYADRAELVSAGASLLYGFVTLGEVPPEGRLALVRKHAPVNAGLRLSDEQLEKFDLVMSGHPAVRRALGEAGLAEVRRQLQAVVDEGWGQMVREAEERFDAYNARGLEDAVGSGLLELHTFGSHTLDGMLSMAREGFTVEAEIGDLLREYVRKAEAAIEGPSYPLFDDLCSAVWSTRRCARAS
jgi:hypothetical protein